MDIKYYKTPGEFLADNADFLRRFELTTQLSVGNAAAHRDEPCTPELLFGRCEENGETILLFSNTLPWNLLLHSIPGDFSACAATVLLAEHLKKDGVKINGLNATQQLSKIFTFAYGGKFCLKHAMDIMELRELTEPPVVSGKVRVARPDELDYLFDWRCEFNREALREEPDTDVLKESFAKAIADGRVYVLELNDGTPVSMAAIALRELPHGVCITDVYTPKEHRGNKYAQNTVAAICREKLSAGAEYITLFVDKRNPISNHTYAKIGFHVIEDNFDYRVEE